MCRRDFWLELTGTGRGWTADRRWVHGPYTMIAQERIWAALSKSRRRELSGNRTQMAPAPLRGGGRAGPHHHDAEQCRVHGTHRPLLPVLWTARYRKNHDGANPRQDAQLLTAVRSGSVRHVSLVHEYRRRHQHGCSGDRRGIQ